ncbi:carbonic anhydrase [Magnetospirillum sp. 15-1]|uniref:carbonic anhydrase n=1 Tax=Magnetospirillum sp. 15-1 TaxID=1979370 RepID=UPI000BBC5E09|nr:carbonic anhydrase [Magnetospirillum sp. 15-1]
MGDLDKLLAGFQVFRATYFGQRPELFQDLVKRGQRPKVLVIACSDSRVDPALLLNAEPGELFVVRNVANLVPPHQPDEHYHGTSAAIEFAVRDLEVSHVIVLGHSGCGGIQALCNAVVGRPPDRQYINRWVDIAAASCCASPNQGRHFTEEEARATEQGSVIQSLENLMTFPWVRERVENGRLALKGWWFNMDDGGLWTHDPAQGRFEPLGA